MGDVVMGSRSRKLDEPLTKPEMVLSPAFNFHLLMVGMPRGAVGIFVDSLTDVEVAGSSFDSGVDPPIPNKEKVGLGPDG